MADPFVLKSGSFPSYFAPKGWHGVMVNCYPSRRTRPVLAAGHTYGGDGKSNFRLPTCQGNAPMASGTGPGLSLHDLGETSGSDTVTLLQSEIPAHGHGTLRHRAMGLERQPEGRCSERGRYLRVQHAGPLCSVNALLSVRLVAASPITISSRSHVVFQYRVEGVFPPRTLG